MGSELPGHTCIGIKEGYDHLEWAEEIDWYDVSKPLDTIFQFLELVKTKFPKGIQEVLL